MSDKPSQPPAEERTLARLRSWLTANDPDLMALLAATRTGTGCWPLEEVSNSSSNLGLDVTNDLEEPVRLTVKFNDKSAIDVKIPGHPSDCHDSRV
jgi:hypothetical protein